MLRIHVGCLPADTKTSSLLDYFTSFGNVINVDVKYNDLYFCTGSATVTCQDMHTYSSIMNYNGHVFEGRKIYCSEFMTGKQLKEKTDTLRSRRVFVSNISFDLTNEELKWWMEHFGEVESAYRIVSVSNVKMPYGYVAFKYQGDAERAVATKYYNVRDRRMKISKFNVSDKEKQEPLKKTKISPKNVSKVSKISEGNRGPKFPAFQKNQVCKTKIDREDQALQEANRRVLDPFSKPTQSSYHKGPSQLSEKVGFHYRFNLAEDVCPYMNLKYKQLE